MVTAALKAQIEKNGVSATATSRVIEAEISTIVAQSGIPAVVMSIIIGKIYQFFKAIAQIRGIWLPAEVRMSDIRRPVNNGNHRQQFHALRDLLPHLRHLLERLSSSHHAGDPLLSRLGRLGVLAACRVLAVVANAYNGLTDEIVSPPTDLRRIWKPVAREHVAPEDGDEPGHYTEHLWRTGQRVCDVSNHPVSETEIQPLFGPDATRATRGDEKLPYACGAHKCRLVHDDPIVSECTARGFHMTSGPSGTAYRFLNLWLVLNGSEAELPAVRLAVTSLLLSG